MECIRKQTFGHTLSKYKTSILNYAIIPFLVSIVPFSLVINSIHGKYPYHDEIRILYLTWAGIHFLQNYNINNNMAWITPYLSCFASNCFIWFCWETSISFLRISSCACKWAFISSHSSFLCFSLISVHCFVWSATNFRTKGSLTTSLFLMSATVIQNRKS